MLEGEKEDGTYSRSKKKDCESIDTEFVEGDNNEPIVCIVEHLLFIDQQDKGERHSLFRTRCTIQQKVCNVIVDSGSCENIIVSSVVKAFKLLNEDHLNPSQIGWIKKGRETSVNKKCKVSLSIGKSYRDNVLCDVVDIDACHLLLRRLWQFDLDIKHHGRDNKYTFMWNNNKIVVLPLNTKIDFVMVPSLLTLV